MDAWWRSVNIFYGPNKLQQMETEWGKKIREKGYVSIERIQFYVPDSNRFAWLDYWWRQMETAGKKVWNDACMA